MLFNNFWKKSLPAGAAPISKRIRISWHIQPYSRILVSTSTGETYDVPPALMKDPNAKMGDGGSSENSNYQMCIKGDFAWVNHDEVSVARDGRKTYSHEIRILEKIDGSWKLVGQSVHMYKVSE